MIKDFAIFILSHGRPEKVDTVRSLNRSGYTGNYYIVIDNEDKKAAKYYEIFGDKVIMFDKAAIAETFDEGDNFQDRRAVIYARNVCFILAEQLGIKYFMELDDDYTSFRFKMNSEFSYADKNINNLDKVINKLLEFYFSIPAKSIAIGQNGDYIGGKLNDIDTNIGRRRKCMNSFICSTDRPFQFVGRINEDVNTYTSFQSLGNLFLTFPLLTLQQATTQNSSGGMTELYLDSGTYVKSFYTVMYHPSAVKVKTVGIIHPRLHHHILWDNAVPCIISEQYRKASRVTGETV